MKNNIEKLDFVGNLIKRKFNNNLFYFYNYDNFVILNKIKKNNFFKSINLFFKNGLLLKFLNNFCLYCSGFYLNIFKLINLKININDSFNFYKYFNEIKILIGNNFFFKNPIILFNWYFLYFNFLIRAKFFYNLTLKKKKKNNFNRQKSIKQFFFIKKNNRIKFFFKWLKYLYILNYKKNFKYTFNFLLNDIFLNFKSSQLYKYKLFLYNLFLIN